MGNGNRLVFGVGLALLFAAQFPTGSARAAIDAAEAGRCALKRVPGRIESVALDHEIRWEVFKVLVRGRDGVRYEVVLDARDGGILWAHPRS